MRSVIRSTVKRNKETLTKNMRLPIALFMILFTAGTCDSLIYPLPNNTVVQNGTTGVILNCTATDDPNFITWTFYDVMGSGPFRIANGFYLTPNYSQTYRVEQSGKQNNLIILTATPSTAGTYRCSEVDQKTAAQLIIVNSAVCSSSISQPTELYQNQYVQMTCTIEYVATSSYVEINIIWSQRDYPSSPVNSPPPQITTNGSVTTAVSTIIQQTGYWSPFPVYQSKTIFQMKLSNLPSEADKNAPYYTNFCLPFNSSIPVNYLKPANDSSVIGAKSGSVYQEESISCSVDANPAANYSWLDVTYGNTTNTSSIRIWHEGKYICTAWNKVSSTSVTVNLTVLVTTTTSTTTITSTLTSTVISLPSSKVSSSELTPPQDPGGDQLSTGAKIGIGIGVSVGVLFLVGILFVVICQRYQCFKRTRPSEKVTFPSTAEGEQQKEIGVDYANAADAVGGRRLNDVQFTPYEALGPKSSNPYEQLAQSSNAIIDQEQYQALQSRSDLSTPLYEPIRQ